MEAHRVPDLQLYLLAVNVDHARAELDTNGQVVHRLESFVSELEQQAAFAWTPRAQFHVPGEGVTGGDTPCSKEKPCPQAISRTTARALAATSYRLPCHR